MAKRRAKAHAENHERWLVSYADFITLLFAFFVVMYGMSAVDAKKMKQVAQSFQQAFNVVGTGGIGMIPTLEANFAQHLTEFTSVISESSPGSSNLVQQEQTVLQALGQTVQEALQHSADGKKLIEMVQIYIDEHGLVISLAAKYFFDSGKAVLRPEVLPIVDEIAGILKPLDREIRIEGHTDDVPIQTAWYPSNWELSAARATYVIKYLVEKFRFPPQRLSAVGYGEFRPITSNATDEGRARNRRVDIVVLSRKIVSYTPSSPRTPDLSAAMRQNIGSAKE
jgi:chemotaxis protein MotB